MCHDHRYTITTHDVVYVQYGPKGTHAHLESKAFTNS